MENNKNCIHANSLAEELCSRNSLSRQYHENSKLSLTITEESIIKASPLVMNKSFSRITKDSPKTYLDCEKILLLNPDLEKSLQNSISCRKSHNLDKKKQTLPFQELSSITWAAYGMIDNVKLRRTIPSAGALYPCEVYMLSLDTELKNGLYHYNTHEHSLSLIKEEDIDIRKLFVSTIGIDQASAIYVITGIFNKNAFKYGERAYRFMLLEAGEICQNISLAAAALELNATSHGGTADFELEEYIGIDGISESVIIAVGIT